MNSYIRRALYTGVAMVALSAPLSAQAEVKVGFLGGFTGPIESLVPPIGDAAKLAATHINEQGGLLGDTVAIVTADTTCADATAAGNAADRLVNVENVAAIVGAQCSGATISSANTAGIPGNVVMISPASTSPALTELEDNDLVFRTAPSDAYQGEVLARVIKGKGVDEIAITYVNNDYGKGFAEALAAAFETEGGTVAANEAHEDGKADYRAELGSLSATGATALVVLAYADGSGQTIVRQALEAGEFQTYIGGDGMVSDTLPTNAGASIDGMIATKPGTPDIPGASIYGDIAKAGGLDPTATFAAQSYDAAFLLALAMQKKGSADRDGMSVALRDVASAPGEIIFPGEWEKALALLAEGKDINYEGASGSHEFDAKGDVPGVIVEMTVADGSFTEVGLAE